MTCKELYFYYSISEEVVRALNAETEEEKNAKMKVLEMISREKRELKKEKK